MSGFWQHFVMCLLLGASHHPWQQGKYFIDEATERLSRFLQAPSKPLQLEREPSSAESHRCSVSDCCRSAWWQCGERAGGTGAASSSDTFQAWGRSPAVTLSCTSLPSLLCASHCGRRAVSPGPATLM